MQGNAEDRELGCCGRSLGAFLVTCNEIFGSEKFKPSKNENYRSKGALQDIDGHIRTLSTFEGVLNTTAMASMPLFYWFPWAESAIFGALYTGHTIVSCTRDSLEKEKKFLEDYLAEQGKSQEQQRQ